MSSSPKSVTVSEKVMVMPKGSLTGGSSSGSVAVIVMVGGVTSTAIENSASGSVG